MAFRLMEADLMQEGCQPPIVRIAEKLRAFSQTYTSPYPIDRWRDYPTHDKVDPMLGHWAMLSALALEKTMSSARTYRLKYRDQGLDNQSMNPNTSYVSEAKKEIVLRELSLVDLLALRTLKTLSETTLPKPEWVHRTGLSGETRTTKPVSPERTAQLEAFAALMQEVRSCKSLQHAVFNNLDSEERHSAKGYSRF
ncbi:hypothetical protein [Agrobacterium tumefaciens]|uniref:hypothetical protein n=1 Tax=Agrobacterium tumefaciens TaxID=358 RepID=UPI003B9F90B1